MIHLDTSVLIDALTGSRRGMPALRRLIGDGVRVGASTLVLYEWRRGPRTEQELAVEQVILSPEAVVAFGSAEAEVAARLYSGVSRARGRELDIAIAACAVTRQAELWTLNPDDFRDLPGLRLFEP